MAGRCRAAGEHGRQWPARIPSEYWSGRRSTAGRFCRARRSTRRTVGPCRGMANGFISAGGTLAASRRFDAIALTSRDRHRRPRHHGRQHHMVSLGPTPRRGDVRHQHAGLPGGPLGPEPATRIPVANDRCGPDTLAAETLIEYGPDTFGAATAALQVGRELWVGTARDQGLARFRLPTPLKN